MAMEIWSSVAPVVSARVKTGISHRGENRENYQGENWVLSQG
jgi:hypothetical protein